ncbi:Protein of uncharacterised function (DUF1451) [Klebsiella pneumoniae]|uniref:Protein of uncharacterized function (DUF1451) n=1 Tax=Klebsiella pneumoniae TaxID=573 RepID=A0A378BJT5_KLEPN|nr:Protein of uncharacterised function (DUF1451) [Klebsiella pneumoniae]
MMNKVAQYYRELVSSLSERLRHGERDIDALVTQAREKIVRAGDLTQSEIESVIAAVKRDLEEFARSYEESHEDESDSVFMRVIKESCGRSWLISPTKPSSSGGKSFRI